ncbi:PQQ-binding-like beta-propeller repeat protein [Spirochaeta dissipatitropha]
MFLKIKRPRYFATSLWLLSAVIAAVYIVGIAGCSIEETQDSDDSVQLDDSVQDMDQGSPGEEIWVFTPPQESVDWSQYSIDRNSTLWVIEDNFIPFQEPVVFESIDNLVLCVQTINGIVGINGNTGDVLWEREGEVVAYYADNTLSAPELHIVDRSGFTVSLDPFNGEVSSRFFSSWEAVSVSDDWPTAEITAIYHEAAYRLNHNFLSRLVVDERSATDVLDSDSDGYNMVLDENDILISTLPFRAALQPSSYSGSEEMVSNRFSVPVSGRYEFFISNFESQPVLFGISSTEGQVLQNNEDYGAITDGFVIDLRQASMYELWFRFPHDFPEGELTYVNAALLMED